MFLSFTGFISFSMNKNEKKNKQKKPRGRLRGGLHFPLKGGTTSKWWQILKCCDADDMDEWGKSVCVWLMMMTMCLHLDSLLLAELRQGFLDSERSESGSTVSVPALPHYLGHHSQGLEGRGKRRGGWGGWDFIIIFTIILTDTIQRQSTYNR